MIIYSKIDSKRILHIIQRKDDIVQGRTDIVPSSQFIQCAALKLPKDTTFKPHKHIWKPGSAEVIAQESWVVISGQVEVILYDIDNRELHRDLLNEGDISITLESGHNYRIVTNNTLVYEFKTGPYSGQQNDKMFI